MTKPTIHDHLTGTATPSRNIPFHELQDGFMKCSCGKQCIEFDAHGTYSPEKSRRHWLDHLEEMILRERREREIYIFEQQARPYGFMANEYKTTGSRISREEFNKVVIEIRDRHGVEYVRKALGRLGYRLASDVPDDKMESVLEEALGYYWVKPK